jgi:hypothetical protein
VEADTRSSDRQAERVELFSCSPQVRIQASLVSQDWERVVCFREADSVM